MYGLLNTDIQNLPLGLIQWIRILLSGKIFSRRSLNLLVIVYYYVLSSQLSLHSVVYNFTRWRSTTARTNQREWEHYTIFVMVVKERLWIYEFNLWPESVSVSREDPLSYETVTDFKSSSSISWTGIILYLKYIWC